MKWYKIFDFDVLQNNSYEELLIKSDWTLPIRDIYWKVNVGDYVKKNECLFICKIDSSFQGKNKYFTNETYSFNSPSSGFIYYKPRLKYGFGVSKNTEICAIVETIEEIEDLKKNDTINCYLHNYIEYKLITSKQWNYVHNGYYKFFSHPTISLNKKKINQIINWFLTKKDLYFGSYGYREDLGWDCFFYINDDYSIDMFVDRFSCLIREKPSLPDYIIFRKVFGNFSIYFHETIKKEDITLKGCPNIVFGNFDCSRCNLTNLKYTPNYIEGDFIIKRNKISSFVDMPSYIGGCFNFSNNDFTDEAWEYCRDNIDGEFCDYNHKGNKFIKYRKELY